jgi:hypothetical protein
MEIISTWFEEVATRVCLVDYQDSKVYPYGKDITHLGTTLIWVREIPNISKNLPKHH